MLHFLVNSAPLQAGAGPVGIRRGVLCLELLLWGAGRGAVGVIICFCLSWLSCLANFFFFLFFPSMKKTNVYFLLCGPELNCLLRKCRFISILKVDTWHWI